MVAASATVQGKARRKRVSSRPFWLHLSAVASGLGHARSLLGIRAACGILSTISEQQLPTVGSISRSAAAVSMCLASSLWWSTIAATGAPPTASATPGRHTWIGLWLGLGSADGLRHAGQAHVVVGQSDRQAVGATPRGRAAAKVVEVQQLRGRAGVVQARAVPEEQRGVLAQPEVTPVQGEAQACE